MQVRETAVPSPERLDLVLVGGGLANGLIAWRLRQRRPDLRVLVLEADKRIGGNHTWSFHQHDLSPAETDWIAPLVAHAWPRYEVRFPDRRRTLATGYRSVTSERFRTVIAASLGDALRLAAPVAAIEPQGVVLADGTRIEAGAVIDGRGPSPTPHLEFGYQKFLGQEFVLDAPHGLSHPIIMDATVAQFDGYRFVYVLPLDARRLLVEDTYYADGPALDPHPLRERLAAYAAGRGWRVAETLREEEGVLPIAIGGDIGRFWEARRGVPASGLTAALFHPVTGYSLPDAVRLADRIASQPDLAAPALFALCREHSTRLWRERSFFRQLNRMLFFAGEPRRRYQVLQHFYRLPDDLVARFYAGTLTAADKLRILTGRPPVPVIGALRALVRPRRYVEETA